METAGTGIGENSLSRITRYLVSAILLSAIGSLLRASLNQLSRRTVPALGPLPLFRDPVCGTFVSPEISFSARSQGVIQHFCSARCRDLHLDRERQPARA
jgi:YHS domain-containing protein